VTAPVVTGVDRPAWVREIDLALGVHPQIILTGNVRDIYKLTDPSGATWYMPLEQAVWTVVGARGYAALLTYSAAEALSIAAAASEETPVEVNELLAGVNGATLGRRMSWDMLRQIIQAMAPTRPGPPGRRPLGLLLPDVGRLLTKDSQPEDERLFLSAVDQLSYRALRHDAVYPAVFWVIDQPGDLPAWFTAGNHVIRTTTIPDPDLTAREAVARDMVFRFPELKGNAIAAASWSARFAALTHGLHCRALQDIVHLAKQGGMAADGIADAVRAYRVGVPDNPWSRSDLRRRISTEVAHLQGVLDGKPLVEKSDDPPMSSRVLGQPDAIRRVLDILTRSVTGLGGAQMRGVSARPRGLLFFAGPTGVGKTELAKAVAHVVFGDQEAYLRFDMSEFAAEHNEARLIGAPPGFIGYDSGGELTNGVRARPFQVILFDEIEKANPRILDKFLQILDDGRLTDGRGATVHFTESVLIFTTNLGIIVPGAGGARIENVTAETHDPAEVDATVRDYLERYFREDLGRPELYNRLREGIVVFDFLRPPVPNEVAEAALDRVLAVASERSGVPISMAPECRTTVLTEVTRDVKNGGRGIVSAVETVLVNPLARALFTADNSTGQPRLITRITRHGQNWQVELR